MVEITSWINQYDYAIFLALFGWLLASLLGWSNLAGQPGKAVIPWRNLGAFCLFQLLDLALLFASHQWNFPVLAHAMGSAAFLGWYFLFEFSRGISVPPGERAFLLPVWSIVLLSLGLGIVSAFFGWSVVALMVVFPAFVSGHLIFRLIRDRLIKRRILLAACVIVLVCLVPLSLFQRVHVYLLVHASDAWPVFASAFTAVVGSAVLGWSLVSLLWVIRLYLAAPAIGERLPRLSNWAYWMSFSLVSLLVVGYYVVNWSGARAQKRLERDFLFRVQTAALSIDHRILDRVLTSVRESDPDDIITLRLKVDAIRDANEDIRSAYIWTIQGERVLYPLHAHPRARRLFDTNVVVNRPALPEELQFYELAKPYIWGPVGTSGRPTFLAHAPVNDPMQQGRTIAWLGLEIDAWQSALAIREVRFQAIAILGLFSFLVVFFLYYQMQREAEGELILAKERAEAADSAKSEFLAVISHEIRTPLQSVLGYSELLAQTPLTSSQKGCLETIKSQGNTLLRIVQDILDFSSLRKSNYELKNESFHLPQLLEQTARGMEPLARRREVEFTTDFSPRLPVTVRGDDVRLRQILTNLLGNAVKFSPNGKVALKVPDPIPVEGVIQPQVQLSFIVEDNGVGISPDDLGRMFEPFTQLSSSQHFPREGAGLGLAIVRRLCELMGGSIDVQSELGRGSTFTAKVALPLAAESAPPSTEPEQGGDELDGCDNLAVVVPLRILVVDDNPFIRQLSVRYFASLGYRAEQFDSGTEAVAHWDRFDLILMDLRMPGMDGAEACRRIRSLSGREEIPYIIGVSATLAESEIERATQAGINDFLGKPFFARSLAEAIKASPLFSSRSIPSMDTGSHGNDGDNGTNATWPKIESPSDAAPPLLESNGPSLFTRARIHFSPSAETDGVLSRDLVHAAMMEIPGLLTKIRGHLENHELQPVAETAHYLSNTLMALGLSEMEKVCRQVQISAENGEIQFCREQWSILRSMVESRQRSQQDPVQEA